MARPKAFYTLKQLEEKTGISYTTLLKYARDFEDDIPSEGEGRARRYPTDAINVFRRLRSDSKPGRKPAAAAGPKLGSAGSRSAGGRVPAPAVSVPLSMAPLELGEEDRAMIRALTEVLKDVAGQMRALTMGLGAVEAEFVSMGNRGRALEPAPGGADRLRRRLGSDSGSLMKGIVRYGQKVRSAMDEEQVLLLPLAAEELVGPARQAVRAFFLSDPGALQAAMGKLGAAFVELDGIDYRAFCLGAAEERSVGMEN